MIHLLRSRVVNDYFRRVAMSTFPSQVVAVDRFRGVNVDLTKDEASALSFTSDTFDQVLKGECARLKKLIEQGYRSTHCQLTLVCKPTESEESWCKENKARAIWFKIPHRFSHLIPSLVSVS